MVVEGMRAAKYWEATCRIAGAILPGVKCVARQVRRRTVERTILSFMGFAPMNDPKIAVAVYVENGGLGATYGVPIGALMMEQYLKGKLSPENEIRQNQ